MRTDLSRKQLPSTSPPEPGEWSTVVLLSGWNEVAESSGVEHDAARGQLAIASDVPFAHHDRTGSLRWIRSCRSVGAPGVSPSAVGRRMPGSCSGEVAGKAPGIVQVLDQRFAHEHARTQAAGHGHGHGPEIVIPVLRDGAQARDEVLIKAPGTGCWTRAVHRGRGYPVDSGVCDRHARYCLHRRARACGARR
jgi:hypothetical protein